MKVPLLYFNGLIFITDWYFSVDDRTSYQNVPHSVPLCLNSLANEKYLLFLFLNCNSKSLLLDNFLQAPPWKEKLFRAFPIRYK